MLVNCTSYCKSRNLEKVGTYGIFFHRPASYGKSAFWHTSVMSSSSSFFKVSCRSSSCLLSLTLLILRANSCIVFSACVSNVWSGWVDGVLSSSRWKTRESKATELLWRWQYWAENRPITDICIRWKSDRVNKNKVQDVLDSADYRDCLVLGS